MKSCFGIVLLGNGLLLVAYFLYIAPLRTWDTLLESLRSKTSSAELLIPQLHVEGTSCSLLFEGDLNALQQAEEYQQNSFRKLVSDEWYINLASDCDVFLRERNYIQRPVTEEEGEFPIAYSILMYTGVEQFERLLRAIYRPQNHYCVHVDQKSTSSIHQAVSAIANCLPNVFIASRLVNVHWGQFTNLEPEIICMGDLWKYKSWRYFINLTGQEFPLKTNLGIVRILKAFHGANNIMGTVDGASQFSQRWSHVHENGKMTSVRKSPFPANITMAKGGVHVAATRPFVDYVLHNDTALAFLEWLRDTSHPDETFFNSLYFSPQLGVPGSYNGRPFTGYITGAIRGKIWQSLQIEERCHGKFVRNVCIPGVRNLRHLANRREMFFNKLHIDFQPLVFDCMEQWIFNWTRDEANGDAQFDASIWESEKFVRFHT